MAKKQTGADELFELCEQTISDYSTRDTDLDLLEDYYFLEGDQDEEEESDDEGIEIVHSPHGTNAVDLVQDLLAGTELTITVPARSDTKADKKLADDAERFLGAVMRESERAQGQGFLSRSAWLVAMRGCLAGRVMPVKSRLKKDDEGFSQTDRLPLLIQIRDPRYVYPSFNPDGLAFVVERWERTVQDVRGSVGADALADKKPTDKTIWTEYWDATRCCYWADGELVKVLFFGKKATGPWVHGFGGLPYTFEFARQTGKSEPEYRVRPMLAGVKETIEKLDLLDSMGMTFAKQYNGDAIAVYSDDDDFKLDLTPGAKNYLAPNEKIEWIRGGRQPLEIEKERAKYEALFQRGTFPYSLYGQDPGRIMAGFAINLLNQAGQTRLRTMLSCVETFAGNLLSKALMVAENNLAPLVGAIDVYEFAAVEGDDGGRRKVRQKLAFDAGALSGYWAVETRLGELMPADEQSNVVLATRVRTPDAQGRPLLSWETTVEKFKLTTSPAEERSRIDRELAMADPEVMELQRAIAKATVMKELTDELAKLDVDAKKYLASVQQAQVPPGGGPPPSGGPGMPQGVPGQPPMMPPGPPMPMQPGMDPGMLPPGMLPPEMQGQLPPGVEPGIPGMMG